MDLRDGRESFEPRRPRVTLKYDKSNFITNPSVRHICLNSSDLGRISKRILNKCMGKFRDIIELQMWFKTRVAIDWFRRTIIYFLASRYK